MQVVSTTLDILINISRVASTRETLVQVPTILADIFQTMLVYRDSSPEIFSKCCAVLQFLSASEDVSSFHFIFPNFNNFPPRCSAS